MLPTPGVHHLHLNSVDHDTAIDFYVRQFPSTAKGNWGGMPALMSRPRRSHRVERHRSRCLDREALEPVEIKSA
jgi:hypothetical protein